MSRPRLSIKTLMAYIASAGVLLTAVARADLGWITFLFVFHGILLFTALLGIILKRGPERAFWIGFALFGWASFLVGTLAIETSPGHSGLGTLAIVVGNSLNELINYLLSNGPSIPSRPTHYFRNGSAELITRMIVFSMVLALLGGQIARTLARGGPFDPPPAAPD